MNKGFWAALGALSVLTSSADAAPLTAGRSAVAPTSSAVDSVHYRDWRHCHWRHGERWCHGGYDRGYDRGGGIVLRFGSGHRRNWDGGHHRRDWDDGHRR